MQTQLFRPLGCSWPLATPGPGLLPALDAIIVVHVAGGSQRFVVKARGADGFLQFLAEFVDRAEVASRGWNLQPAGFEELLIAPIHQARDFAVQQPAGTGPNLN